MSEQLSTSPYAPPRAGRTAWFWRTWFGYCRACPRFGPRFSAPLDEISTKWRILPVLCVPLLGVQLAGRPLLRRFGPLLFGLAAVFALACVGQIGGGLALGFMAAIHALGVADYVDQHFPQASRARRALRRGCLALACAALALVISPTTTRWLVVPVGSMQGVLLFNPLARKPPFAPRTTIAFLLPNYQKDGLRIREGIGLGSVIAGPGDTVMFSPGIVTVNGVRRHALPLMPKEGTVLVPAGHALVWPVDLQSSWRRVQGALDPEPFVVADSALVGRPYKRWFWRTFDP